MNNEVTQQAISAETVLYRCACGATVRVDRKRGATCDSCGRHISPKALQHDLAKTMTLVLGEEFTDHDSDFDETDFVVDELIGQKFGHFEIVQSLGRGGQGHVYQGLDTSLQRYVAVKLLRHGIGTPDERDVTTLLQEAVSQARVEHPNIVTIYYVGKQDGTPFFAMELVNGPSVSQRISEGSLGFQQISEIAMQITKALEFSYGLDIIHGDIKPPNILLQPNGVAKLSDFGMARRVSGSKKERIGGTPNYLAPELLAGEEPSIQTDMYALGVTLYEMTFGKLPVQLTGSTIDEWRETHSAATVQFPSPWPDHLPEEWLATLKQLLARDPQDRFANFEELIEQLEETQSRSNVAARPVPRIIAGLFDWMLVFLLMMPCQLLMGTPSLTQYFAAHPTITFLVQAIDMLPILAYTVLVFFWRHSVGRSLMQLRVVNRYGFQASGRKMVLRSIPRMALPWAASILFFVARSPLFWVQSVSSIIVFLTVVFMLLNVAFLLIYQRNRSLHDLMFDTCVVLGK